MPTCLPYSVISGSVDACTRQRLRQMSLTFALEQGPVRSISRGQTLSSGRVQRIHPLHTDGDAPRSRAAGRGQGQKRFASTQVQLAPAPQSTPSPAEIPIQPGTLTILHKTRSLLPRAFGSNQRKDATLLKSWERLLAGANYHLAKLSAKPIPNLKGPFELEEAECARIFVYSCDEFSGAEDLITALLEDPISTDQVQNEIVRHRWKVRSHGLSGRALLIESGHSVSMDDSGPHLRLRLASPWLDQFPLPIKLVELAPSSRSPSPHSPPSSAHSVVGRVENHLALYSADIPIIVCNPLTTPLESLLKDGRLPCPLHPNTILVFTATTYSPEIYSHIRSSIAHTQFVRAHPEGFSTVAEAEAEELAENTASPKILFVDPSRALDAIQTLRSDLSKRRAVQKFQDDFMGSKVSGVTDTIRGIFSSLSSAKSKGSKQAGTGESTLSRLRKPTVHSVIRGAFNAFRTSLSDEEKEIRAVQAQITALRAKVDQLKAKMQADVLGADDGEGGEKVAAALKSAEKEMIEVMKALTWWKAAWRVDEIGQIVGSAAEKVWCKQLEDQLILHAGRLSAIQKFLNDSTTALLASHSSSSIFHSPVLQNSLSQLASSPSYPITPSTLTGPLYTRLDQLKTYPTTQLHLSAQRMVLTMSGSIAGSAGIGWAAWAGYLSSGILGLAEGGVEVGTAVGVGMLGAVAGTRWAVGKWEKAKRRWWNDWKRVGDGLGRDLKATLENTVDRQVVIVPTKACEALGEMVHKRKEEMDALLNEVDELQLQLDAVEERNA
ncbi:hypothetical protein JAAARDRAFT_35158 [Jaapia argillacea MUCL 33604]|uniref:Mmc1 C-terminal domain-containing protein n=1 Tax=Jaapia argillacea MUCL 33604 TaxID=933084 RepID=A0A067PRK3_9AGAM|nr:hypothetical protein JAAARDRAFT_35158 [Jaapia argillacea MUCL 33604]